MKKIGISYETIKSGELKDVGTLDRHLTENERKMLSTMIMDAYEQFVEAIAESRGMEVEEVYKVADGSVYSGRHARDFGLVDTLGGFEDAVRIAADLAGIGEEPEIVREFKPKKGLWDLFVKLNNVADRLLESGSNSPRVMYLY
jgi:protease-4